MILSGRDIQLYIKAHKLSIDPVDPGQFQQNGIDLILDDWQQQSGSVPMFYLGATREVIKMPDDLMAFVALRSTWARRGYLMPHTVVDAGFEGNLTLEIWSARYAAYPIGLPFAHLIFARTTGPCELYSGKYSGQRGITEAK